MRSITIPEKSLVITNGVIIPGTGHDPIPNGTVVIEGNRILAVGEQSSYIIPDNVQRIDAEGGSILPGLFNTHAHNSISVEQRRKFLMDGITSVCELGSPAHELVLLDSVNESDELAARLFFAGPIVTAPGGYPDGLGRSNGYNYEVSTPFEGREAVKVILAQGAHVIKIALDPSWNKEIPNPMLDVETVQAIADEAHNHGAPVRAHMIQLPYFNLAVEAGIDVIEHMPFPMGWPNEEEKRRYMASDDPIGPFFNEMFPQYDPLLKRMADEGIAMVPTVSALIGDFYRKADRSLHQEFVVQAVLDIIRRFRDQGGIIALGNDFNDRFIKERFPLTEMKMLLEAGMTPMEVIETGTRHAAAVCGQSKNLGTLEPGKLADILIVEGNPLDEFDAICQVNWIILGGSVVKSPDQYDR